MAAWSEESISEAKGEETASSQVRAPSRRDEVKEKPNELLLGSGVQFEGKLTFTGTVRIDAKFVGSIITDDVLVVGDRAKIDAEITCGTVVVGGEVNGNITAKEGVELHRSARVHGNVETASLSVEKGALLHGAVHMKAARAR